MVAAFVAGALAPALTPCPAKALCSRRSARNARTVRATPPRMAFLPTAGPATVAAAALLARTADIGPFTNVDVESALLFAAIGGGVLIASLVAFVIVRF